jgi:phosphatidylglycerophosphate synthase
MRPCENGRFERRALPRTTPRMTPSDAPYEPTSRRPIAALFRASANGAVRVCLRRGIHADAVSYSSILGSALAAACFWQAGGAPWLVIPAALFCFLRLWLNMLDGMVAIAAGQASRRGEILNDLPDRASDVLIFVGVAHSGLCRLPLGYWAAIAAVLTAYVGLFGQAVGAGRQFGGVMSKPWRMVLLAMGSWIMAGDLARGGSGRVGELTILDLTLLAILAGCVQTIWVRLMRILRSLAATPPN